jgi:hypothetical protein
LKFIYGSQNAGVLIPDNQIFSEMRSCQISRSVWNLNYCQNPGISSLVYYFVNFDFVYLKIGMAHYFVDACVN